MTLGITKQLAVIVLVFASFSTITYAADYRANATIGEFLGMAAIYYHKNATEPYKIVCGGILINQFLVLTTASCLQKSRDLYLLFADTLHSETLYGGQYAYIDRIYYQYKLAIAEASNYFSITNASRSVDLEIQNPKSGFTAQFAGWGNCDVGYPVNLFLRKKDLVNYGNMDVLFEFSMDVYYAMGPLTEIVPCQVDHGGGLYYRKKLVGVATPSARYFFRISDYHVWINSIIASYLPPTTPYPTPRPTTKPTTKTTTNTTPKPTPNPTSTPNRNPTATPTYAKIRESTLTYVISNIFLFLVFLLALSYVYIIFLSFSKP